MSATGARSELGKQLRAHRRAANLTGTRMAELLGTSQTWVSRIEAAGEGARITPEQVEEWLRHVSAPVEVRADLVDLALQAEREITVWKQLNAQGWATHQKRYVEIERDADTAKLYSVSSIPGILQTSDYTRYMCEQILGDPPEVTASKVASRTERQQLLYRPTSRFQVVLAEQVIRHRLGGPVVMVEQLRRLVDFSRLPTVDLRIIPANTDMPVPYGTGFDLYEFPGDGESLAFFELAASEHKEMNADAIAKLRRRFDQYRRAAVRGRKAEALIQRVADEMTAELLSDTPPETRDQEV